MGFVTDALIECLDIYFLNVSDVEFIENETQVTGTETGIF